MSTLYADIHSALVTQLDTLLAGLSGSPQAAWHFTTFSPTQGTPWLDETLMHAQAKTAELGINGQNYLAGIFQVSVHTPLDKGRGFGTVIADQVRTGFLRGSAFTYNGTTVRIKASWLGPNLEEQAEEGGIGYMTPVSVAWFMYANNS